MGRNGKLTERELSQELLQKIGMGNAFQRKTISVTITEENQKVVNIPISNFDEEYHKFEIRLGGVPFSDHRYTIKGSAIQLNNNEEGFTIGRQLEFVCYWNALILSKDYMPQFIRSEDIIDNSIETKKLVPYAQNLIDELVDMNVTPCDVQIEGRTLVNLLGRSGNAIYQQAYTHTMDPVYEGESFKFDNIDKEKYIGLDFNSESGKIYLLLYEYSGDPFSSTYAPCMIYHDMDYDETKIYAPEGERNFVGYVARPSKTTSKIGIIMGTPYHHDFDAPQSFKIKNVRCYEIPKEIYDKIDVDPEYTWNKLSEKFPYVDDIKSVVNPYIECNENLISTDLFMPNITFSPSSGEHHTHSIPNQRFSTIGKNYMRANQDHVFNIENLNLIDGTGILYGIFDKHDRAVYDDENRIYVSSSDLPLTFNFDKDVYMLYTLCKSDTSIEDGLEHGIFTLEDIDIINKKVKPVLVEGPVSKTYEECHNSRIMFETKVREDEKISRGSNGRYVKNNEWEEMDIIGSDFTFTLSKVNNNHKHIWVKDAIKENTTLPMLVKYDGSIVPRRYPDHVAMLEGFEISSDRNLDFALPDSITGWGPDYNPSQEEIKAFFLGWSLMNVSGGLYNDATGASQKVWRKLWCGIGKYDEFHGVKIYGAKGDNNWTGICPTAINDQGYTPYRLIYKKEKPTIEEVNTHGNLIIKKGVDVNIGSGLVLGEDAKVSSNNLTIHTNGGDSVFKNRCDITLKVLMDHRHAKHFTINNMTSVGANVIRYGKSNTWFGLRGEDNTFIEGSQSLSVDYLIYRPDVVTSFPVTINLPQTVCETIEKTIEELSNISTRLSGEDVLINNKIERLPQPHNPNLLINGDFQVWQRGVNFSNIINYATYTADRWRVDVKEGSTATVAKDANGLKFTLVKNAVFNPLLVQQIEVNPNMLGKPLTLSGDFHDVNGDFWLRLQFFDGVNHHAKDIKIKTGKCSVTYTIPRTSVKVYAIVASRASTLSGHSFVANNIKLEFGDIATPNSHKTYGEELALCQRYFVGCDWGSNTVRWTQGYGNTFTAGTGCWFFIPLATSMRFSPTLFGGAAKASNWKIVCGGSIIIPTSIDSVRANGPGGILVQATIPLSSTDTALSAYYNSDELGGLDAEIY